ncbi:hypothetical protein [Paenibacillus aceti]|uniref:Uncharacterized protein n=1 Tax=Paenibacillus aceti TaxID=1820010 RepID=A0ABQ1VRG6_9BACL|nr:hypothetical protein [Paenibacillus aceti]GGF86906.1 hypothetical protein GCM10010913_05480 [Paenibacillus aceti]
MSEPLVFDGVGKIWTRELDGTLKYIDEKINSVMFAPQFAWEKVFGGESGYAFHLTAQDLADTLSIEVPRYSPLLAELSQGAATEEGEVTFDENEEGILTSSGYQIKAPEKFNGTFVDGSEEVYMKSPEGKLTKLERAAVTPTKDQYTITADGKITSDTANDDSNIIVVYKWKKDKGTRNGFKGTRKPKPFKFIHRFELTNDRTGEPVQVQLTVYKAIGGGTLNVGATRKTPSTSTLALEVLEPDVTPDNPNGYAAEIIFSM